MEPKFVRLSAKSRHGKNRITNHGEIWKVIKSMQRVSFASGDNWMLLESHKDQYTFWMSEKNDEHNSIAADVVILGETWLESENQ